MNKSSRHSKITGDFAEHLTLYWLSKYGFECARVDHTGIDIIARNPYNKELMGISVKSRSRKPGREKRGILIQGDHFKKVESACETFGCKPYFSIVADIADEIRLYIVSMEKLYSMFPLNKGLTWRMRPSFLEDYDKDPEILSIRLKQDLIERPNSYYKQEKNN